MRTMQPVVRSRRERGYRLLRALNSPIYSNLLGWYSPGMRYTDHSSIAKGFTWLEGVTTVVVMALLIAIIWPAFSGSLVNDRGTIVVLVNAKQIHYALKAYAVDHNGLFPEAKYSSNKAYQALLPDYLSAKKLFFARGSAWTPDRPSHSSDANKLHPGENHFAYVPRLRVDSNADFPLVAEGFVEGKPGVYSNAQKVKGGRMVGRGAVVVRIDGAGRVERLNKSDYRVYDSTGIFSKRDIFAPAPDWLAPNQVPLNPVRE